MTYEEGVSGLVGELWTIEGSGISFRDSRVFTGWRGKMSAEFDDWVGHCVRPVHALFS